MTKVVAPEKLTLTPDYSFGDPWFNGSIGNDDPMEDGEDTSYGYTRDDISDAPNSNIKALCDQLAKVSIERTNAYARIEQLEQALRFYVANHLTPNEGPWGINSTDFGEVARAALAGEP
jgi:hypothetical protein